MNTRTLVSLVTICLIAGLAVVGEAATITIVNNDGPNEGFNDPTPVAPVGGNPGTTLGEQRLIVFEAAARIWGAWIGSDVEIRIRAQFDDIGNCTGLGATSTLNVWRDFPGAPHPGTWYHNALADAIAGYDLLPVQPDMNTTFNSRIDTAACPGSSFYYGLDGQAGSGQFNLLPIILHETAHGLGFSGFTNLNTGEFLGGYPDCWSWNVFDNDAGLDWNDMTNGQRFASIRNERGVVWTGSSAAAGMPTELLLGFDMELEATAPPPVVGLYPARGGLFGGVPPAELPGEVELVNDGSALPTEGCNPLVGFTPGRIALVDRGGCEFGVKALNAELAGASAAIIANNAGDDLVNMAGGAVGDQVTIPALFIGQTSGQTIRTGLPGLTVIERVLDRQTADVDGRPMLYTPASVVPGSSVNHWEVTGFDTQPDLLMEPFISATLHTDLDITPGQMEDVGHRLIYIFADGFEGGDTSAWTAVVP